jgi:hypothetical protein
MHVERKIRTRIFARVIALGLVEKYRQSSTALVDAERGWHFTEKGMKYGSR